MNLSKNSVISELQNTAPDDAEQKLSPVVYECQLGHAMHGYSTAWNELNTRNMAGKSSIYTQRVSN